jgi:quercetin dioxygenase-like cupin family protein
MADVVVKRLGEMEASSGGGFVRAAKSLGAESFGMNVLRLPPNYGEYPEHDEAASGQEEVYVVVKGSATLTAGGSEHELTPLAFARVPAGTPRKWVAGGEGATIIAIGGVPGAAYGASSAPQ